MHAPRARCAYCRDGKESRPAHVCEVRGKYPEKAVIFTFYHWFAPEGSIFFLLADTIFLACALFRSPATFHGPHKAADVG